MTGVARSSLFARHSVGSHEIVHTNSLHVAPQRSFFQEELTVQSLREKDLRSIIDELEARLAVIDSTPADARDEGERLACISFLRDDRDWLEEELFGPDCWDILQSWPDEPCSPYRRDARRAKKRQNRRRKWHRSRR